MIYNSGWHDKPTATRETGRRLRRRAAWPVAQGLPRHFSAFDTQIHAVRRPLPSTGAPMDAGIGSLQRDRHAVALVMTHEGPEAASECSAGSAEPVVSLAAVAGARDWSAVRQLWR
jgi:hypothetical protein